MAEMDEKLFSEYRLLILKELERLSVAIETFGAKLELFRSKDVMDIMIRLAASESEINALKVKAAIIGAIGGVVFGTLVSWFIQYITSRGSVWTGSPFS